MSGDSAIWRATDAEGVTEEAALAVNKIEFNKGVVPDATGRIIQPSFEMVRDVSFHGNPQIPLNFVQDNLLGSLLVTITGYAIDHTNTKVIENFFDWQTEDSQSNALKPGIFGLRIDNLANGKLNLEPSSTKGYVLHRVYVEDQEDPRTEVGFIVQLYRNGAI